MRYMTMVKVVEGKYGPPPPALMQALGKLQEDATKAGVLIEVGGLKSSATGASLRLANGRITVMDGPFTEAKELIGGYAVYDTKTKEECVEWARRFLAIHKEHWPEFEGEVELREMMVFTPGR